jgi:hypothetical protein
LDLFRDFLSFFQRKKPKKFAKNVGAINWVVNCLEKTFKVCKKCWMGLMSFWKKPLKFAKNVGWD